MKILLQGKHKRIGQPTFGTSLKFAKSQIFATPHHRQKQNLYLVKLKEQNFWLPKRIHHNATLQMVERAPGKKAKKSPVGYTGLYSFSNPYLLKSVTNAKASI